MRQSFDSVRRGWQAILSDYTPRTTMNLIYGTMDSDILSGSVGHDEIYAYGGNDTVHGSLGADYCELGDGNDHALNIPNGLSGADTFLGGAGDDSMVGSASGELFAGETGDDTILAGAGNDTVFGGAGRDFIDAGAGADLVDMGYGQFFDSGNIDGNGGRDTLKADFSASSRPLIFHANQSDIRDSAGNVFFAWSGFEDFRITGSAGNDTIQTGAGNDTVSGAAGHDWISLGVGHDYATALGGNDTLIGEAGSDTLFGGTGNNSLVGGSSDDSLSGNYGRDTLDGGQGHDTLLGGPGIDSLLGGPGNDTYEVDNVGDIMVEFGGLAGGLDTVLSSITKTLGPHLENLTLTGNAVIHGAGNSRANHILGNSAGNVLFGYAGHDFLHGGDGADRLYGTSSHASAHEIDTLTGGTGADIFVLGSASTEYYGDGSADTAGQQGYALITDFEYGDKILLHGPRTDYYLAATPVGLPAGSALFLNDSPADSSDELIAVLQGSHAATALTNAVSL